MDRRILKRVARSGKLSAGQVAKDDAIRRKIREEFPPAPPRPVSGSLSDALKRSIRRSDRTVYQIARKARVSQNIISRFFSGERDIRVATADWLARTLGLKLVDSA